MKMNITHYFLVSIGKYNYSGQSFREILIFQKSKIKPFKMKSRLY